MRTISIDWDGVIHSYTSPWTNAWTIPDPPVEGAIPFLKDLVASGEWDVAIFSTRNENQNAILSMKIWLLNHAGEDSAWIERLRFPTEKPKAFVGLDDRVITFEGTFPSLETLASFKPWNRR